MNWGTEFPSGELNYFQEGNFLNETVLWVDRQTYNSL